MTTSAPIAELGLALEKRRHAALRSFLVRQLAAGFGGRAAFGLGVAIAVGFAGWMLALFWVAAGDTADLLLIRGVRWLCLVAGGVATVGLAGDVNAYHTAEGITALLQQRGYDSTALHRVHLYATWRLLAGTLLVPSIALCALAVGLSQSFDMLLGRLLLAAGIAGYVVLLSGALALCARGAVGIDRRRSRWVLVAILLGPEVARSLGVMVPSIPSMFGALLDQVATLGVAFL